MRLGMTVLGLAAGIILLPMAAQAQQVVDVPTRAGQTVRAIVIRPAAVAGVRGSVILLAGGHGNLSIGKDGSIAWGKGIHVVRARADFAKAGFAVMLPDIAADHKKGEDAVPDYRASVAHAMDIGALISHMRKISAPVYLVATDRGAVSAVNAAVRLSGGDKPDGIAITSGMLMNVSSKQASVERLVPGLQRLTVPVLMISHAKDACKLSSPTQPERFQRLLTGVQKVEIKTIQGGVAVVGDQCGAQTPHGFAGQDADVIRTITDWVKSLQKG